MNNQNSLHKFSVKLSIILAVIVFLLSFFELAGMIFQFPFLEMMEVKYPAMKPGSALCLIFLSIALILSTGKQTKIARILISISTILSLSNFFSYYVSEPKIAELAGYPFLNLLLSPDNRMLFATSLFFIIINIILWMLTLKHRHSANFAHLLLLPILVLSYILPASYILKVPDLPEFLLIQVTLKTSFALTALSIAILMNKPDTWLTHVLTNDRPGSIVARKMLPILLIIPLLIGWLRLYGDQTGMYSSETGVVMVVTIYTFVFLGVIWFSAREVNSIDEKRRESSDKLKENQNLLKALFDSTSDAVYVKNLEGRYQLLNEAVTVITGKSVAEIINNNDYAIFNNEEAELIMKQDRQVIERNTIMVFDVVITNTHGEKKYFSTTKGPLLDKNNNIKGVFGIAHDITNRKRAEEELKNEKNFIEATLNIAGCLFIVLDNQGRIVRFNKMCEKISGYAWHEVINKNFSFLLLPDEAESVNRVFNDLVVGHFPNSHENYWVSKEGEKHLIYWTNTSLIDNNGRVKYIISSGIDITDRKMAEDMLSENKDRLERAQAISHLGSWELDVKNNILTWSDEAYRIFGLQPQEFEATYEAFLECVHPDDRNMVHQAYTGSITEGRDSYEIEHRVLRKNNEIRFVHEKCTHIRDKKGNVIKSIGMTHDITERKKMEMELQHYSRRLEILSDTASQLLASENPQKLIDVLCRRVMDFLDCQMFFNFIVDKEKGKLHLNSFAGIPDKIAHGIEWLDFGVAVCGCVARDGKRIIAENIPQTPDPRTKLIDSFGIKAYCCHPLMSHGTIIGTLSFGTNNRTHFNNEEISLMKAVCDQVAIALSRMQNENALLKNERKLRQYAEMLEHAPVLVRNMKDEIIVWNSGMETLYGFTQKEALGHNYHDLLRTKTSLPISEIINIIQKEDKWEGETQHRTKKGDLVEVSSLLLLHQDETGKPVAIIEVNKDITQRKQIERELQISQEKLNLALENGNIGVWEWNLKTNSLNWDVRMEKMFGFNPGAFDCTYETFEKCLHDEDVEHTREAIKKALNENQPFETVYRIKSNDNNVKYITAKALVDYNGNGKPVKMTGVCFDITEMKKGTEKLLFKLNEELLRSNKELEQFAYVASHDLQEPLRMISSFTQLLAQRYKDKLDNDAMEFIEYAVDGAARMQILINDLLAYSRINTKRKFEPIDMHYILGQAVKNLSLRIQEKNALVTNGELPMIKADEGQMVQLMQNLIGNALKFCNKAPLIHISAKDDGRNYIFSIKDNGIGIESQYFSKIFQIFQRLQPKKDYEGTGIGLAICKRIVEHHGGKMWVESEPGKGSTFYFTILKKED